MPTIPGIKYVTYTLEVDKAYRDSLPNPYAFNNDAGRERTVQILANQFGLPKEILPNNVAGWDTAINRGINDWLDVRYTPGELGIYGQVQGRPGQYVVNVVAKIRSL